MDTLEARELRTAPAPKAFREESILTQHAFARLLEWLDDGEDSHGERYLEMRRRLVSYFDRRNRPAVDDLADETLNRVARMLVQSGAIAIRPPARYCYIVARFVLLEDCRRGRKHVALDEPRSAEISKAQSRITGENDNKLAIREQSLECLDRCLQELRLDQRDLAIEYYRDAKRQRIEHRRSLAATLGISTNALAIRACRIRESLTTCVEACRGGQRQIRPHAVPSRKVGESA